MRALMDRSLAAQYHAHCPWGELRPEEGLVIARGEGVHVFDVEGRRYIDAISGGWNVSLGYSARPLIAAATAQLETLPYFHTLYNCTTEASLLLSEQLKAAAPFETGRVVYSNSGSEAVEVAVKLAWLCQAAREQEKRRKILAREGSVHGSTIFTACLGGLGLKELFGPEDTLVRHLASPNRAFYGTPDDSDEAMVDRLLAELEAAIIEEGADTIAAMVIEPIAVVEGFHASPASYLHGIRTILDKYGILLIFDEVISGCGRTGTMFASEWLDCQPDIVVLAKGLTSGYAALAATLPSRDVGDAVDQFCAAIGEFPHAMTTAMHPVAMRVAAAALTELAGGVLDHVRTVIPHFQTRLQAFAELPGIARVDGVGLGGSIHLEASHDPEAPDRAFQIARECRNRGLIIHGQHGAIIVAPALIATSGEMDEMFDILDTVLGAS